MAVHCCDQRRSRHHRGCTGRSCRQSGGPRPSRCPARRELPAVARLAMGLAAFAARDKAKPFARISAALFLTGIVLFSGSLYLLALTGAFAFMVPFGGAAFIAGWIVLAMAAFKLEGL